MHCLIGCSSIQIRARKGNNSNADRYFIKNDNLLTKSKKKNEQIVKTGIRLPMKRFENDGIKYAQNIDKLLILNLYKM